jgi:repressor LexA
MKNQLTDRQEEILQFIQHFVDENDFVPTIRDIASHFGMASPYGVQRHLDALEKKGYLTKQRNLSRSISLVDRLKAAVEKQQSIEVPVIGRVAAGMPITAIENQDGSLVIDRNFLKGRTDHFALKVRGDSMIDEGIYEDDYVVVSTTSQAQHEEIIVAKLNDEVTIKRFYRKNNVVQLVPANKKYAPIPVKNLEELTIIGRVVGVMRWL